MSLFTITSGYESVPQMLHHHHHWLISMIQDVQIVV